MTELTDIEIKRILRKKTADKHPFATSRLPRAKRKSKLKRRYKDRYKEEIKTTIEKLELLREILLESK